MTAKFDEKLEELEARMKEVRAAKRKAQKKIDENVGRRLREASERYPELSARQLVRVLDPDKEMKVADFVATVSNPGFAKVYAMAFAAAAAVSDGNGDTDSVDGVVSEVGNSDTSAAVSW